MAVQESEFGNYRTYSWSRCPSLESLCDHIGTDSSRQDLWTDSSKNGPQLRRTQTISGLLQEGRARHTLDIGCADGYLSRAISARIESVVGIDIDSGYLSNAQCNAKGVVFVQGSIESLPFRNGTFDSVCLSEVLEHLPLEMICAGIKEIDRILSPQGVLVVSTPHRECISFTECPICGKPRPTNESNHLHSFDEDAIASLLPNGYEVWRTRVLPSLPRLTCHPCFNNLPLNLWLPVNSLAYRLVPKGTWLIMAFRKS